MNRDDIAYVMDICARNEVLRVEEATSLTKESVDAKTNAKTQTKGKKGETKETKETKYEDVSLALSRDNTTCK